MTDSEHTNNRSLLVYSPLPGVQFDERGMQVSELLTYPQWQNVGESLAEVQKQSYMFFLWAWGDWLCYGKARYGEKYTQAMSETGLAYQSLVNYKWVAEATPRELRGLPNLGQSHYERVVTVKDYKTKRDLLQLASKEKWAAKTTLGQAVTALLGPGKEDNNNQQTSSRSGSVQDKLDLAHQQRYMLEQQNVQLQLEHDMLQTQIGQAKELLEPVLLDQVDESDRLLNIERAMNILQAEPNGEALALVKEIVTLYRQGDMTALIDTLDKLSLLMEK